MGDVKECGGARLSQELPSDFEFYKNLERFERNILPLEIEAELNRSSPYRTHRPRCKPCQNISIDDHRTLILKRNKSRAFKKFELYILENNIVCIESNFAHRNPYE